MAADTTTITRDEWLAELERVGIGKDADGMTTDEMARATGRSLKWVRDSVRELLRAGRWEQAGTKTIARIDGRPTSVTAYRPVEGKVR